MAGSPQLGLGIDFTNDTAHFMPRTCDIGRNEVDTGNIKRKRPPNALLARGWIQVQAVVGAAGCQRWGSREEMSACLVVGRRVMTSRRYA